VPAGRMRGRNVDFGKPLVFLLWCNQPKFPSPPGAGRDRQLTASPPGRKLARSGGIELVRRGSGDPAVTVRCVLSDNSVVGHTRINQVVKEDPLEDLRLTDLEFTHTRVIKGRSHYLGKEKA